MRSWRSSILPNCCTMQNTFLESFHSRAARERGGVTTRNCENTHDADEPVSAASATSPPPATPLSPAALVGFESNNKYEVRNSLGQNVFYAVEENDCLNRQCCGPMRPFTIHVLDNFGQEVITVTRPLKCMSCFFPCCLQEVGQNVLLVF